MGDDMHGMYRRLIVRDIPPAPEGIVEAFERGTITPFPREDCVRSLREPELRMENGVAELDDGSYVVAASCRLDGLTRAMVEWWFWWFPKDRECLRRWVNDSELEYYYAVDPSDTEDSVSRSDLDMDLCSSSLLGSSISYRVVAEKPSAYGISDADIAEAGNPLVYCGHLMARKGLLPYVDFVYAVFPEDGGFRVSVRFWAGRNIHNMLLRTLLITREKMVNSGIGFYREYSSVSGTISELYSAYMSGHDPKDI